MKTQKIIDELRGGKINRQLSVIREAADALELLEERIAIMSEALSAHEWDAQQEEAERRVRTRLR